MCNNPIPHPELTGGQPMHHKGLSEQNGLTLCGKHNAFPSLEQALDDLGVEGPVAIPASRMCPDCTHIRTRLN